MTYANRRVLIVGLGASGDAAARVLVDEGASVRVSEARSEVPEAEALRRIGVEVLDGGHAPAHLDGVDLVVVSPGVPEHAPVLAWAADAGLPIWSELELGARLASVPYAAVTGTNGKTTTTEMVASILRAGGLDAVACGNVGFPFSLAAREQHDALVVEASSFQLRFHERFHPRVSVLLNLAEDHLDWHGSMAAYTDAKAALFRLQGPGDVHVGNADDPVASEISRRAACEIRWFTLAEPGPGQVGYVGGELVARLDAEHRLGEPRVEGAGPRADAAAAAAVTLAWGVAPAEVAAGIAGFQPLPHRGETVATVGRVRFVDDSKATNPHATLASLEGRTDVVLIAGGLAKGVDLSPLRAAADRLRAAVVLGQAADELARIFEGAVPVRHATSIEDAVSIALDLTDDGVVLLAPACASQDMFRDYKERGERFAAAARGLVAVDG